MSELTGLARGSWPTMVTAVVLGVGSALSTAVVLSLAQRAMATEAPDPALALPFAGACAGLLVTQALCRVLLLRVGHDVLHRLRLQVADRVLMAPVSRVEELGAARLLAALTDDVAAVADAVPQAQIALAQLAIALGCIGFVAWLSWPLALALAALSAVGTLTYLVPVRFALAALARARRWQDRLHGDLEALLRGLKELKLHRPRRTAFVRDALHASAEGVRREGRLGMTLFDVAASWGQTQYLVGVGIVLFALPLVIDAPRGGWTATIVAILYLALPIELLLTSAPALGRASTALRHLGALDLGREVGDAAPPAPPAFTEIVLRAVRYRHPDPSERGFEVGPIDLALRPAEVVFLTGGNGSGKTTLAKLVTGLHAPIAGEIVVDGEPVTDLTRDGHRQRFSAVFSDSHLFDRLHGIDADPQRVDGLLRLFGLDQKVRITDGQLSTTALSQGQRRRLMLLVARLEDRPVYVLDEWAADQDPGFREHFYTSFLPALRAAGKCVLVVSHDDRFYGAADRLLRLEEGRLAPAGPL